jgi:hypothetical protein
VIGPDVLHSPIGIARPEGAAILDELHDTLVSYIAFPSDEAADAVTVWTAATHAQGAWEHATRLVAKSPHKRCGKTRLLEIVSEISHAALRTTNISPAALVRSINESDPPTLILDEGDAVFAKRRGERSEGAEDLRGILNAGHSRGWPYLRWNQQAQRLDSCPTFAMAAIAAIGDLPDTIEDRAVVIVMQRRAPGETVAPFRRRSIAPLHELRDRLHEWVASVRDDLAKAEPQMPVEDRTADTWEPLVAIADAARGDWPERIRKACKVLTASGEEGDADSAGERLLADTKAVFSDDESELRSADLLERLHALDGAPWGDWYGRPLTAHQLARMLRLYGIKPKTKRDGKTTPRMYVRAEFVSAWSRYLPTTQNDQNNQNDEPDASESEPEGDVSIADRQSETPSETRGFVPETAPEPGDVSDVLDVSKGRPDAAIPTGRATRCPSCGERPTRDGDLCFRCAPVTAELAS